jgi:hypothetical protein
MSNIIHLRQQNRGVVIPTGQLCTLVWIRKIFEDGNIYEMSLERLDGGYTGWFAELINKELKLISCSYYLTRETLLILIAEEARKDGREATYYLRSKIDQRGSDLPLL